MKLAHGEYVSLGKVESSLKQSKYVENCCAYGDSRETFIVMLVVPVQSAVEELASSLGLSGSFEEHCENKDVIGKVLQDIHAAGKESRFLSVCFFFITCRKFQEVMVKLTKNSGYILSTTVSGLSSNRYGFNFQSRQFEKNKLKFYIRSLE